MVGIASPGWNSMLYSFFLIFPSSPSFLTSVLTYVGCIRSALSTSYVSFTQVVEVELTLINVPDM